MGDILRETLLYDFYGELLTKRQRDYYELYYLNDLSLSEIALQYGISPQAVNDALRRTARLLRRYEDVLGTIAQHAARVEMAGRLQEYVSDEENRKSEDFFEKIIYMAEEIKNGV